MDYHAWLILEKSLGILDYGNNFNSAVANSKCRSGLFSAVRILWKRIQNRQPDARMGLDPQSSPTRETCCHA